MDIPGNTVKNSVLFQNMGTAANKLAYVQDHNAIFLLDARFNKTASFYIEKSKLRLRSRANNLPFGFIYFSRFIEIATQPVHILNLSHIA